MGAYSVDLDSEAGWVRFALGQAKEFNFHQLQDTFKSANYELFSIEVVVVAEHRRVYGKDSVVLGGSGQEFPFSGAEPWTGSRRIHALAEGWRQFEPRLVWTAPTSYPDPDAGPDGTPPGK